MRVIQHEFGPENTVQDEATVLTVVRDRFLSLDDVCERHALPLEEYPFWRHEIEPVGTD